MSLKKIVSFALIGIAAFAAVLFSYRAVSEDIDLFAVSVGNVVDKPNVLFVIDNSANWSRQSQQWPGGLTQGQSEARAIKTVINELAPNSVNVGMIEYSTAGSASENDGGYVRYHIRPMTTDNKASFSGHLQTIFDNINEPIEKRSLGNPYGDLFWDIYNYLAGGNQSHGGAGTPSSRADSAAYSSRYSTFRSPLTSADSCRRTIVIFIGNNTQGGPTADSSANASALAALDATSRSQIPFVDYTVQSTTETAPIDYSNACYSSASACTSAENNQACRDAGFTSCACDDTDKRSCAESHFSVVGINTGTTVTRVGSTTDGPTAGQYTGEQRYACLKSQEVPTYNCPPAATTVSTSGDLRTTTTTQWSNCSFVSTGSAGCSGQRANYEPRGTRTITTVTDRVTTSTTRTPLGDTPACYTSISSCSTTGFDCGSYNGGCACDAISTSAGCTGANTNKYKVVGTYTSTTATPTGTFSAPPTQGGGNFMMDEWARFLRLKGVPLPGTDIRTKVTTYTIDVFNKQQDPTFSALLFNAARAGGGKYYQAKNEDSIVRALREIFAEAQAVNSAFASASLPVNATNRAQNENQVFIGVFRPDDTKNPMWFGNLKRYQLITNGGTADLGDKDGNSAINLQTGFIADCAASFWTSDSGDYWSRVISTTHALGACTTNGTSDYSDLPDGPLVEKGGAAHVLRRGNQQGTADADGNFALNRSVKTLSSGSLVDFTAANTGLASNLVNFVRGADTEDEDGDGTTTRGRTEPRASIHGDVVHSRPQPVNYGGSTGVVVFYGSNDGTYRAVRADNGRELWSFIAPEHFGKLGRLKANSPKIRYYGDTAPFEYKDYFFDGSTGLLQNASNSNVIIFPTMRRGGRKVYAFQVADPANPQYLWSRGCPNLTNDDGCDTGFSGIGQTWSIPNVAYIKGYSSTRPVVIFGGGYDSCEDENTSSPGCGAAKGRGVYVVDAQSGALVKHFNFGSTTGSRSVAADVSLIDVDSDGKVDYAYAADTGGNIFRMDFIDGPSSRQPLASENWTSKRVAYTNGAGRKFLFPPALLQNGAIIYLALGSGDREHPLSTQYPYSDVLNRFYVFTDNLAQNPETAMNLDNTEVMSDNTTTNTCEAPKILPSSSKKGWFMDLNQYGRGEQTVTSALIAGGFVVFSTNRPTATDTTACSNSLGEARGYFVNLLNGSGAVGTTASCGGDRSGTFVGGGLPPSPVVATVPITVRGADGQTHTETKTIVIGAVQRGGGASSIVGAQIVRPSIASRRRPVYWQKSGDSQ